MDNRNLVSTGALGLMVFFAFGSVGEDLNTEFRRVESGIDRAEPTAAAASGGTGIAECDAYLKQYRCYLEKTGVGASAADQAEAAYKQGIEQAEAMGGGDMVKKSLADSCKQTSDTMKSMFDGQGC